MNLFIDLGSTNIKFALCGKNGREREGKTPFPAPSCTEEGKYEVPTAEILKRVTEIVRAFPEAENVLFSVQMHGYVLSEREDRYVSWRDVRSQTRGAYERYHRRYGGLLKAESGTSSKPNLAVYSLLSEAEEGRAPAGELFSLGSYLVSRLTGNNVSHESDLCALGFYLRGGRENGELLSALPYRVTLPVCTERVERCGTFERKNIYTPVGDQQCSVMATEADGRAVLNVGTAAQICRVRKGFVAGEFESRPYFNGDTLCTRTGLVGGAALQNGVTDGEDLYKSYAPAFADVGAKGEVVCTGGAFSYHRDLLYGAVRRCGLTPVERDADALYGLEKIWKEQI